MENTTFMSMENATYHDELTDAMPVFKVVFTLILATIMFGMGCAVEYEKLIGHIKKPVGIAVGLSCQIILMPILSYSLVKIFGLSNAQMVSFMLVGCSPGGSNSNVVTYLIRGDMSLSVSMTTLSNLLSLGTFPLLIMAFTAIEQLHQSFQIPYWSLAVTLTAIGVPIVLGIAFKYKYPEKAKNIPKICAGIAIVMLVGTIISLIVVTKLPFIFTPESFGPAALLPALGILVSYSIAWIPGLNLSCGARKAISIETAIQNSGIANSVLLLTYSDRMELLGEAITVPLLYNISQTIYILVIVVSYRLWLCMKSRGKKNDSVSDKPCDNELHERSPLKQNSRDDGIHEPTKI